MLGCCLFLKYVSYRVCVCLEVTDIPRYLQLFDIVTKLYDVSFGIGGNNWVKTLTIPIDCGHNELEYCFGQFPLTVFIKNKFWRLDPCLSSGVLLRRNLALLGPLEGL